MNRTDHAQATLQLVFVALLWSVGGLLIKAVDWPPLAVAGGRGVIAAVFLLLTNRGLQFRLSGVQIGAGVAYAACTISFVVANKLTTAANAILIQYTAPVWVALFGSWLLGERASRVDWVTITLVLVGLALFLGDGLGAGSMAGNLTALFCGVAFAAMTLLLRRQRGRPPTESIILGNLISFVLGLPWMIGSPLPSAPGLAALAALGVFQLGLSYWLYSRAIRHVTAMEAVLIPVLEPLLNPFWVFLARGEKPSALAFVGGILVLGAVVGRGLWGLRFVTPGKIS